MKNIILLALAGLIFGGPTLANETTKSAGETQTTQSSKNQNDEKTDLIDINKASAEELTKLPRIGPVTAERIVMFREEHEGFKKKEELMNVRGIGEKTFERLAPLIKI